MVASLDAGHAHAYFSDFPSARTLNHPKCVTLPHLGASTMEAEENCAVMVAEEVRDFLEHGDVRNAVNFPELVVPRQTAHRCVCVCAPSDQASARVATALADAGVKVRGWAGATKDVTFLVADTSEPLPAAALERLSAVEGLLSVRVLPA
jgi:D-3-phosphoglycerate dehydrogenase